MSKVPRLFGAFCLFLILLAGFSPISSYIFRLLKPIIESIPLNVNILAGFLVAGGIVAEILPIYLAYLITKILLKHFYSKKFG